MGIYRRMGVGRRPFFMRIAFAEAIFAVIGFIAFSKYLLSTTRDVSSTYLTKSSSVHRSSTHASIKDWDQLSRSLTQSECRQQYPLLFAPIDEAVSHGEFDFYRGPDDYAALVSARIKNNRLYVIANSQSFSNKVNAMHRMAALNQLHKALLTSPEPLPDTVFSFTPTDYPKNNSWGYSKWYHHDEFLNYWPVPHFGHWSWPVKYIGPLPEVKNQVAEVESNLEFEDKIDKLFWRGTIVFNPLQNAHLRANLLGATENKEWADVATLKWNGLEKADNIIQIPDVCKYKYIAYTEGITYSGRLPFHLLCESVVLTTPINYMMHSTHLIKPLFAWKLGFKSSTGMSDYAMKRARRAWPKDYPAEQATAIFVSPDWSDLEETILWLRDNPKIAKAIAKRQKKLFVEQAYLSESAEMCYWREVIRGWNKVAIPTGEGWDVLGLAWETFALRGHTEWD